MTAAAFMRNLRSSVAVVLPWWLRRMLRIAEPISVEPERQVVPAQPPAVVAPPNSKSDMERFYEKKRLKHDQFVKPQGELPTRPAREKKPDQPKPVIVEKPVVETPAPTETRWPLMVDKHHDNGEDVLYTTDEFLGEFNFRDTILQQLDRYFFYLKRMRQGDPQAYALYRQIGATLIPYIASGAWDRARHDAIEPTFDRQLPSLPHWFNETRPAFGCFAYGTDPESEKHEQTAHDPARPSMKWWVPKFMYFTKYSVPPFEIQPMSGGDIYTLTIWWDRPNAGRKARNTGSQYDVPIFISSDGKTIKALKVLKTEWKDIQSKRDKFSIPSRVWQLPKQYRDWAKNNMGDEMKPGDPELFLIKAFLDAINQYSNAQLSLVRVAVSKGTMTAVFSVNIFRTSYFFQDRDISVTTAGTRAPIFHAVRAHTRKDGTVVKMHFRGLREFRWAGYRVKITVPGLDHVEIRDLNIGMVDLGDEKKPKGMIDQNELGKKLASYIDRGVKRNGQG